MTKIFSPQEGPQSTFATSMADIALYGGAAGGGKALDPSTKILTPRGFKPISKLKVGSTVMNPDGLPCKVIGVWDHDEKKMFKVTFQNGASILACDEHLWTAWHNCKSTARKVQARDYEARYDHYSLYPQHAQVVNTLDLAHWFEKKYSPQIPVTRPVEQFASVHEEEEGVVYAIGHYLLKPRHIIHKMFQGIQKLPMPLNMTGPDLYRKLESLGIAGKAISQRKVPNYILTAPLKVRKLFLQGILDRYGSLDSRSSLSVPVEAPGPLADSILYLARSLGCDSFITDGSDCKVRIRPGPFSEPFRFNEDKVQKYVQPVTPLSLGIANIEFSHVGPARCIAVDNPNRLYIAEDFIVTHNTFGLLLEPLKWLDIPKFHTLILRRTGTEITQPGGLWDESTNIYPEFGGESIPSKKLWIFPNGNKVQMMDIEHDSTLEKRKGAQAPLILYDELTTFTERMFFYMLSRNRSATEVPAYARAATNPMPSSDPTGGWVRNFISWWLDESGFPIIGRSGVIRWFWRFQGETHWADSREELVDRFAPTYGEDVVLPKSFTFVPAKVDDNKLIDPTYKANLMAQGRADREMLLDGCWDVKLDAGSFFNRDWVTVVNSLPEPCRFVRYWDRAASEPSEVYPDPDWTAGVLLGFGKKSKAIYVVDVVRFRKGPFEVQELIREQAASDVKTYGRVKVCIEKDPGAAGKTEARALANHLSGFDVAIRSTNNKDKLTRFKPFSAVAEMGEVKVLAGNWNEAFFKELEDFTGDGKGKDDQVDATSGAYSEFVTPSLKLGQISLPNFSSTSILKGIR